MPPTFCRHNRFIQNCPICRAPEAPTRGAPAPRRGATPHARPASGGRVRIRQAARAADDGYRSALVPGIKLADDARRLADELAFAAERLTALATDPPGLYAEVASSPDVEEALWLALLIACLGPREDEDPFAAIRSIRVLWRAGVLPALEDAAIGPRGAGDASGLARTLAAYRSWAERAGSQAAGYAGEPHWTPERRFERAFERLGLPGLRRAARFDLLVTLSWLGRVDARPASLHVADDEASVAAKRVFGIGDALLIDRRARELTAAAEFPLAALDLALHNWGRPTGAPRVTQGVGARHPDAASRQRALAALEV